MAKSKSKNKYNTRSPKTSSRYKNRYSSDLVKKTVLAVILIVSIVVIAFSTFFLIFTPEKRVKSKIDSMISDYYENYYYENLINSDQYKAIEDKDTAFEKYHTGGLPTLALRQLMLYGDQKHIDSWDFLTEYCDENNTLVRIYMDPPYERKSYHYEISYSCNF